MIIATFYIRPDINNLFQHSQILTLIAWMMKSTWPKLDIMIKAEDVVIDPEFEMIVLSVEEEGDLGMNE